MSQRENDIDSDEGLNELLRQSLAVDTDSEARVLAGVSANIQNVSVPKIPPARSARGVWQHALKTAVVIALTIGLFAMVSHQKPQSLRHGVIAEEGNEKQKEKRPKPDENEPAPEKTDYVDHYAVLASYYDKTEQALKDIRQGREDDSIPSIVQARRDRVATGIDVDSEIFNSECVNERILAPSEIELRFELTSISASECVNKLGRYYGIMSRRPAYPLPKDPHFIFVPGLKPNGDSNIVLAFCRCGNHAGRHALMGDGQVKTVHSTAALQKLFEITAREINLDMNKPPESSDTIAKFILDLGDEDFNVRETAMNALMDATGKEAAALLEAGTKSNDPERASRCVKILKAHERHLESPTKFQLRHELGIDQ